jgi:hypothetical protein
MGSLAVERILSLGPGLTPQVGVYATASDATAGAVSPLVLSPQAKSDLSDFGQLKVPNSGKPEFGWEKLLVCNVKEWVRGFGSN